VSETFQKRKWACFFSKNFQKPKKSLFIFWFLKKCESSTFSLSQKVARSGKKILKNFSKTCFKTVFGKFTQTAP